MTPSDRRARLLAWLVCPACRGELSDEADGFACAACERVYPVVDGVPWMLVERARAKRPCASST